MSGGNSMFSQIANRMSKQMEQLMSQDKKDPEITVINPENRNDTWIGGSIFSEFILDAHGMGVSQDLNREHRI